jgi:hypothetical protein
MHTLQLYLRQGKAASGVNSAQVEANVESDRESPRDHCTPGITQSACSPRVSDFNTKRVTKFDFDKAIYNISDVGTTVLMLED